MNPTKKRAARESGTSRSAQLRVPIPLWEDVERIRHEMSLAQGKAVSWNEAAAVLLAEAIAARKKGG